MAEPGLACSHRGACRKSGRWLGMALALRPTRSRQTSRGAGDVTWATWVCGVLEMGLDATERAWR